MSYNKVDKNIKVIFFIIASIVNKQDWAVQATRHRKMRSNRDILHIALKSYGIYKRVGIAMLIEVPSNRKA